jgi:hypothetical protein
MRIHPLVEIARRHDARIHQRLTSINLTFGKGETSFGSDELRLQALHFGCIRCRVYGDEQVSLLDQGTFAKMYGLNGAGDPRADINPFDGFQATGELVPRQCGLWLNDGDGNGDWKRRAFRAAGRARARDWQIDKEYRSDRGDRQDGGDTPQIAAKGRLLHFELL